MMISKVEICGVNTSKLPILKEPEMKRLLHEMKAGDTEAREVPFSDYNGDLSARQCGSVGGEMVKRMVEEYESHLK